MKRPGSVGLKDRVMASDVVARTHCPGPVTDSLPGRFALALADLGNNYTACGNLLGFPESLLSNGCADLN